MKIAWIIQGDEQWGIRSGSRALITALRNRGVDCPIIALGDGEFTDECIDAELDVITLRKGPTPRLTGSIGNKLIHFVMLAKKERELRRHVAKALYDVGADAAHFRRPNLVKIAGQAAFSAGIPVFWHMPNAISFHYPFDINRRIYQRRCQRYGIVPLANSRYTASTLGSDPVEPRILYLAVDPSRFDPANIESVSRESLGIDANAVVVGVVARLVPKKGQDRAIEATLELVHKGHNLHLLVIGGPTRGNYYEKLQRLMRDSNHADHVHMVGPVTDAERYYPVMDFSLNCRIDPEPCGISVLESMMCQTPPLVHACGGPAETVIDGETGWHYSGGSAADIQAGILRVLNDKDRWHLMGRNARKYAIQHFSLEAQADTYLRYVGETLSRKL